MEIAWFIIDKMNSLDVVGPLEVFCWVVGA